ncbi:hypothetical protein RB620_26125 [Paenibacillus sp. LHD-117]|uniref:hypothetical protein n=1 Tax=Paenibacillus sp. LHD-117 TaxID=3071412 RepID=UPI0027E158AB|nr:hypothetical protein [Paenibacillus sp. LHD-117]MDQ6422910.1 hypothetical protein [Paenibacillus sp. LHD-117]
MQKTLKTIVSWMPYVFLLVCLLFYIVLLRAPIWFLGGIAVGLAAYWGSYGVIKIGGFSVLKWFLIAIVYLSFALLLYGLWYTVQLD